MKPGLAVDIFAMLFKIIHTQNSTYNANTVTSRFLMMPVPAQLELF